MDVLGIGGPVDKLGSTMDECRALFRREMGQVLSGFTKEFDSERCNVLLLGESGVGKSSFINTVSTALSDRLIAVASAGGGEGRVSTALVKYALPDCAVTLWDMWGLEVLDKDTLKHIMEGVLPSHWDMDLAYDEHRGVLEANRDSRPKRRIHNVIFVISHGCLELPKAFANLVDYFSYISSFPMVNPILAISKTDELSPRMRENPCAFDAEVEGLRLHAAEALGIPPHRSVLLFNYYSEERKSIDIDRAALRILINAVCSIERNPKSNVCVESDGIPSSDGESADLYSQYHSSLTQLLDMSATVTKLHAAHEAIVATLRQQLEEAHQLLDNTEDMTALYSEDARLHDLKDLKGRLDSRRTQVKVKIKEEGVKEDRRLARERAKERDRISQATECILCMEKPREIAFTPCGHLVVCIPCAEKLDCCPLCRRAVTHKMRVFI